MHEVSARAGRDARIDALKGVAIVCVVLYHTLGQYWITAPALALYLFLVTVADQEGLSYYSDPSVMSRLGMDAQTLDSARQNLIQAGLVAYEDPLYQVLCLEPIIDSSPKVQSRTQADGPVSIARLFKQILGETS